MGGPSCILCRYLMCFHLLSFNYGTASSSPQIDTHTKLFQRLILWLEEVGETEDIEAAQKKWFKNTNQFQFKIENGVRGVYSVKQLNSDISPSLALAIPLQSLMTVSSSQDINRSNPLAIKLKNININIHDENNNLAILVAHLQCELSKANSSWWWPYLATFPTQIEEEISFTNAMLWEDDILKLSPTLYEHIISVRQKRDLIKKIVKKKLFFSDTVLKKGCGGQGWQNDASFSDSFNSAYAMILSRGAILPGISNQYKEFGTSSSSMVLTPLLDLLNHKRGGARYVELYRSRSKIKNKINDEEDDEENKNEKEEEDNQVFGVGIQTPAQGFLKGEQIYHDYEGDGETLSSTTPGTSKRICDYVFLTTYGFLPDEEDGNSCIVLPWIGIINGYDVMNNISPIIDICNHKVNHFNTDMVKALKWEIDHDYHQLTKILSEQSHFELQQQMEVLNNKVKNECSQEDYEDGWCNDNDDENENDDETKSRRIEHEKQRRKYQILRLAHGELKILEHLQNKCNGGMEEVNVKEQYDKKTEKKQRRNKTFKKKSIKK